MRKAASEALNKGIVRKHHHPVLLNEAVLMASGLIDNPTLWNGHFRRAATSSIVSMVYGKEPLKSTKEPIVGSLHEFINRTATAARPGAHFVEVFPWMRCIPAR